ncbi:hypothetical protein LZ318_01060, partial [Saccharopolyspora indica]|uniref:hypothetical protein n=1 Tax=Saccharopolyspora indica TaxID=1229659 RepID=UPI002FE5CC00
MKTLHCDAVTAGLIDRFSKLLGAVRRWYVAADNILRTVLVGGRVRASGRSAVIALERGTTVDAQGWAGASVLAQGRLLDANAVDYVLLALYFVFVLGIGYVARRAVSTSLDFFLSGRAL